MIIIIIFTFLHYSLIHILLCTLFFVADIVSYTLTSTQHTQNADNRKFKKV
jgi:hypothetical protein